MKRWKKYTSPLMALVLCVGLTACDGGNNSNNLDNSVAGKDWRTTGVVCDSGIITRNGEDTTVQVCVNASNATFYYDKEEQVMFDSVEYPLTLESDAGEAFQSIDFADLNDDGNSDVTMKFNDGGNELLMVWFWDTESNLFAYQPEESQLGEEDEGRGDVIPDEGRGDVIPDEGRGDVIPDEGRGDVIPDEGRGDVIPDEGRGDIIPDEGRGDVIPDEGRGDVIPDEGRGDIIPDEGRGDIIPDEGRGDVIPDEGRGDLILDEACG